MAPIPEAPGGERGSIYYSNAAMLMTKDPKKKEAATAFLKFLFEPDNYATWLLAEPGLFLHAARALGVEPARCAVVEDSLAGIEAGFAAGMTVYALPAAAPLPPALAARVHMIEHLEVLSKAAWNTPRTR